MRRLNLKVIDESKTDPPEVAQNRKEIAPFDVVEGALKTVSMDENSDQLTQLWAELVNEGQARKASESVHKTLTPQDIEKLAREVYESAVERSHQKGLRLPAGFLTRLIGELSGLGALLEILGQDDVEDIAINLEHIYVYSTRLGWQYKCQAPPGIGDALRVLIDRAGQRTPTPDFPIADAMLQVMVPAESGTVERIGLRINYMMPPASPYGDIITLRVSSYKKSSQMTFTQLCETRLPPVERPDFKPKSFPDGDGLLSPEAANYLLSVMVHGGTLIVAGTTGSGKTFIAQRILQEMLDYYPPGWIRLFIIEDANELILNQWSGDPQEDTKNIIYTVTRNQVRGGPPPVTMYDLIRAALRSRPHGIIIGESRGAESWELVRAAATGHGFSAFTLHATSAEQVWARFYQVVQSHPDAQQMQDYQIAQGFAEAINAILYIERNTSEGQVIREITEVSPVVERSAGRPALNPLFYRSPGKTLEPTGNRPIRPGYRPQDLNLPDAFFTIRSRNTHV